MAHCHTPPKVSQRTEYLEADTESDRDSGVGDDAGDDADSCHGSTVTEDGNIEKHDGVEEKSNEGEDFTVFVAFQGNMDDEDFSQKLETVLSGIPNMLDMGQFYFL